MITGPSRRRRLLWLSAPFVVLALLVAGKLLFTSYAAARGTDEYRAGHVDAAGRQFGHLGVANAYERWIASFDQGDALYRQGRFADARERFDLALSRAPADEHCTVRGNLALAGERVGDQAAQAKNLAAARAAYTRALRDATLEQCTSLASRRAELQRKLAALSQGSPPPSGSPSSGRTSGSGSAPPQQRLSQRNQQAASSQANYSAGQQSPGTPNPNGRNW